MCVWKDASSLARASKAVLGKVVIGTDEHCSANPEIVAKLPKQVDAYNKCKEKEQPGQVDTSISPSTTSISDTNTPIDVVTSEFERSATPQTPVILEDESEKTPEFKNLVQANTKLNDMISQQKTQAQTQSPTQLSTPTQVQEVQKPQFQAQPPPQEAPKLQEQSYKLPLIEQSVQQQATDQQQLAIAQNQQQQLAIAQNQQQQLQRAQQQQYQVSDSLSSYDSTPAALPQQPPQDFYRPVYRLPPPSGYDNNYIEDDNTEEEDYNNTYNPNQLYLT